jgi:hypothetical protein
MSRISVDRYNMDRRLRDLVDRTDDMDRELGRTPNVPDGGIASASIALITSAASEAVGLAADSIRALSAITHDVLSDQALTEQKITESITALEKEVESR